MAKKKIVKKKLGRPAGSKNKKKVVAKKKRCLKPKAIFFNETAALEERIVTLQIDSDFKNNSIDRLQSKLDELERVNEKLSIGKDSSFMKLRLFCNDLQSENKNMKDLLIQSWTHQEFLQSKLDNQFSDKEQA